LSFVIASKERKSVSPESPVALGIAGSSMDPASRMFCVLPKGLSSSAGYWYLGFLGGDGIWLRRRGSKPISTAYSYASRSYALFSFLSEQVPSVHLRPKQKGILASVSDDCLRLRVRIVESASFAWHNSHELPPASQLPADCVIRMKDVHPKFEGGISFFCNQAILQKRSNGPHAKQPMRAQEGRPR
jgi:hypothetical protein